MLSRNVKQDRCVHHINIMKGLHITISLRNLLEEWLEVMNTSHTVYQHCIGFVMTHILL